MAPSSNAATFALFAAMSLVFASFAMPAHAATNTIADQDIYKDCISDPSQWSCSAMNLNLQSPKLTGTIPTELSKMTALTKLILSNNFLTGTIPSELSELTALTSLPDASCLHLHQRIGGTATAAVSRGKGAGCGTGGVADAGAAAMRAQGRRMALARPSARPSASKPPTSGPLYETSITRTIPSELGELTALVYVYARCPACGWL
ncbi:hypothetical protein T492DRAFT_848193 [Pavlovales sp. CCMP2436]|nr:hypothetical protein T492DRAFT_848193 [Pavlovales sp. CCMP2436]